jgi:hypothetical protein
MKTSIAASKIADNTKSTLTSAAKSVKTFFVSAASWTKSKTVATAQAVKPAVKKITDGLMEWLKTFWSWSKKNPILAFGIVGGCVLFTIDCMLAGIATAMLALLYRACACTFVYMVLTAVEYMEISRKKPSGSVKIPVDAAFA